VVVAARAEAAVEAVEAVVAEVVVEEAAVEAGPPRSR
jgi:hypothetical protein